MRTLAQRTHRENGSGETAAYLRAAGFLPFSVLAQPGQVLHQHRRKDADDAVKLPLPEAIVLVSLPAEDPDDGAFGKGELLLGLPGVVVQRLRKRD